MVTYPQKYLLVQTDHNCPTPTQGRLHSNFKFQNYLHIKKNCYINETTFHSTRIFEVPTTLR